jgi:hypothetical protein
MKPRVAVKCAALRSLIVIGVCSVLGTFGFVRAAEACWQSHAPSIRIRSRSVAGTVTLNGKPIGDAVLSLHKFLGAYSIEPQHADLHSLANTISAKDGTFSFGEVPPGKYVVLMASPSSESTEVLVVRPKPGEDDTISIRFFADFCQSASAIAASGESLTRFTPPIARVSGSLH